MRVANVKSADAESIVGGPLAEAGCRSMPAADPS
jgi:hypothetical protein